MIALPYEKMNLAVVSLAFVGISFLMIVALLAPTGRFVLVIIAPDRSPAAIFDVISEAGGSYVGSTNFPWMAVAYSDGAGFPTRLIQSGAVLVLDHSLVAGCIERTGA